MKVVLMPKGINSHQGNWSTGDYIILSDNTEGITKMKEFISIVVEEFGYTLSEQYLIQKNIPSTVQSLVGLPESFSESSYKESLKQGDYFELADIL